MTIVEFLLARIADDEQAAERGRSHPDRAAYANDNYGYLWVQPSRVLAECEAKRAIIQHHLFDHLDGRHLCQDAMVEDDECDELRALAAIYSDHPDFDPAWGDTPGGSVGLVD